MTGHAMYRDGLFEVTHNAGQASVAVQAHHQAQAEGEGADAQVH
jgi:hypothetical protein